MKIIKLNFAGTELDAIVGHPGHELLFVGKQVFDAAGLKDGSKVIYRLKDKALPSLSDMPREIVQTLLDYPRVQYRSKLVDEPSVYKMLLRGHAPQSEPFRKWITEEVLPSLRKSGQYDISKSTTPEGLQLAEEFGKLRAELQTLTTEVMGLKEVIR